MTRASHSRRHPRGLRLRLPLRLRFPLRRKLPLAGSLLLLIAVFALPGGLPAQSPWSAPGPETSPRSPSAALSQEAPARRARRLSARHTLPSGASAARALMAARRERARMAEQRDASVAMAARSVSSAGPLPRIGTAGLGAPWTAAGPAAIQSLQFGFISGRVTSLALDPGDPTGNTLYVGTTGGGVWKSTNAAGPTAQVSFTPLTDDLPVYSPSAGSASASSASLSIGAMTALPGGILLAGTGDANDSSDSFFGSGILRSADAGLTWTLISGSQDGVAGNHSFAGLGFAGFAWSNTTPSLVVAALSQSE